MFLYINHHVNIFLHHILILPSAYYMYLFN